MADKCAIDEELSRLESHIAQMHVYLDVSGETGKKMDFLIQEMNREANTIGSKCSDAQMAQNVVNLKSEIEKCVSRFRTRCDTSMKGNGNMSEARRVCCWSFPARPAPGRAPSSRN